MFLNFGCFLRKISVHLSNTWIFIMVNVQNYIKFDWHAELTVSLHVYCTCHSEHFWGKSIVIMYIKSWKRSPKEVQNVFCGKSVLILQSWKWSWGSFEFHYLKSLKWYVIIKACPTTTVKTSRAICRMTVLTLKMMQIS